MLDGAGEGTVHQRAQAGDSSVFPGAHPRARQAPPTGPDPEAVQQARRIAAARQILGFDARGALSEALIPRAYRRLAKRHHLDHGGSVEHMVAINNARDVLMTTL